MFRKVLGFATVTTLVFACAGCEPGYSEEQATLFCEQEEAVKQACWSDESLAQCIDCYMECGSNCRASALCPEEYGCLE